MNIFGYNYCYISMRLQMALETINPALGSAHISIILNRSRLFFPGAGGLD